MSHITPSYRGFRLETLVFHDPAGDPNGRKHERLLAVSVRISPVDAEDRAPSDDSRVFRLESVLFDSIGDARRAGDEYARSLVDGFFDRSAAQA
ncbi:MULTISPECIES: hypothetical protein [Pandoraea]|uniref:Uncharacterized protein n=1 Tax=Pandoraea pnomenusa TaxID=93220 RepID=A0A378YDY6_9BURK|nr:MULTISPECIES: hypothetical protein [Pandoraea]MBN9094592.1 hypothetical protein [Pandoraea pnomenusa]QDH60257.1 hypothetical protein FKQ53_13825 [Pandoraea pnomenusa]QDX22236.1 hypothetical protein FP568_13880 [Pandoraea pnomenusa]SUA75406.1 Uncharacterised protein [Pandoraea pnomenusa]VVE67042.1 hypothetical protein PPN31119_02450 [Pandoraea pnomenusa]